ncbi:MAG: integrase core domain-containing protein [Actinomycetota bacterium]
MTLWAIHQHFARPGTPTDQAWIESFFGHLKYEFTHLLKIVDPAVLRAELEVIRTAYTVFGSIPALATSP